MTPAPTRIRCTILHALLVLVVLLLSGRAHAAASLEMVVLVSGPEPVREQLSDAIRADMKGRGHVVHDPARAIALGASLDAAASSLLAGRAPAEVMRERLGVDVVVMVTVEGTDEEGYSLAVLAATSHGIARRTARTNADGLETIALRAVLSLVSAASQGADAARPADGARLDVGTGVGLEVGGTFDEAEAKRRAWKERGGGIVSYEVRAQVSGILMPEQTLPCVSPKGRLSPNGAVGQGGGGGGGASARVSYLYISPPDPTTRTNSWYAFKIGTGVDFSAFAFSQPTLYHADNETTCETGSAEFQNSSLILVQAPFPIGAHIGLGGFGSGDKWSGLVLGLAYVPTVTYVKPSGGDGAATFNPAGFDVTFDFTTLEAALKDVAKPAHFRISVFILPPVSKSLPLFGTLGLGAVWY